MPVLMHLLPGTKVLERGQVYRARTEVLMHEKDARIAELEAEVHSLLALLVQKYKY